MEKAKRGRPAKIKLITLDQGIEVQKERYGRVLYAKGSLYNLIWKESLNRYGPRHCVLIDENQLVHLCERFGEAS